MTGFKVAGEWLDYTGSVSLEIRSPLFDADSVPGTLSYPAPFPDSPRNRRLLGYPATRSRAVGPVPPLDAEYYIGGVRWRIGTLRYKDYDSAKRVYSFQFEADADALATRIENVALPELDLGTANLALVPETADYVLAPVRNPTFFSQEASPTWFGLVNHPASLAAGMAPIMLPRTRAVTVFPKVVPLLRRVLGCYGYSVNGAWLDDAEIQQLVLYTTRDLGDPVTAQLPATFAWADLLPAVRVADLLLALQQTFALGFIFHPVRREVTVTALRDVVADAAYTERRPRAHYRDLANTSDGFLLQFTADSGDEELKNAPHGELRLGNAKQTIQPAADTLRMVVAADPLLPARQWLLPAAAQEGQSGPDNRLSTLRFLFYRGLQAASDGVLYPLLSAGTTTYAGAAVGTYALAWDGAQGLYQQWHKPWLDFLAGARQEERTVGLTLAEFLTLDPGRKDLVSGLKFLWERISVTAGGNGTLSDAKITYHQIAR